MALAPAATVGMASHSTIQPAPGPTPLGPAGPAGRDRGGPRQPPARRGGGPAPPPPPLAPASEIPARAASHALRRPVTARLAAKPPSAARTPNARMAQPNAGA